MEKTIWKYALEIRDNQTLEMPIGAEILTVQAQKGIAFLWVLIDRAGQTEKRVFEVFGTGHPIRCDIGITREYIGTFQINDGALVFHVFEYTGV